MFESILCILTKINASLCIIAMILGSFNLISNFKFEKFKNFSSHALRVILGIIFLMIGTRMIIVYFIM